MPYKETKTGWVWVDNGTARITPTPGFGTRVDTFVKVRENTRKGIEDLRKKQNEKNKAHAEKHGSE